IKLVPASRDGIVRPEGPVEKAFRNAVALGQGIAIRPGRGVDNSKALLAKRFTDRSFGARQRVPRFRGDLLPVTLVHQTRCAGGRGGGLARAVAPRRGGVLRGVEGGLGNG